MGTSVLFSGRRAWNTRSEIVGPVFVRVRIRVVVRECAFFPKLKSGIESPSASKYDAPIVVRKIRMIRTDDDGAKDNE